MPASRDVLLRDGNGLAASGRFNGIELLPPTCAAAMGQGSDYPSLLPLQAAIFTLQIAGDSYRISRYFWSSI